MSHVRKLFRYAFVIVVLFFSCLVLVELIASKIVFAPGMVMTPKKLVHYDTVDFDIVITVNENGHRGPIANKEPRYNIFAVGDSFTFAFGIQDGRTWTDQLNSRCGVFGPKPLRVINVGKPGTNTLQHVQLAKYLVEKQTPRGIIIGVTLDDDFQQVSELNLDTPVRSFSLVRWIAENFPASVSLVQNLSEEYAKVDATANWSKEFDDLKGTKVFSREIDVHFRQGRLNPGLLYYANMYSDRGSRVYQNFGDFQTSRSGIDLRSAISALIKSAREKGVELWFVGIPGPQMVKSSATDSFVNYGYMIPDGWSNSNLPDEVLNEYFSGLGTRYVSLLQRFRDQPNDLYFKFDGHPNLHGQTLIAEEVCKVLGQ